MKGKVPMQALVRIKSVWMAMIGAAMVLLGFSELVFVNEGPVGIFVSASGIGGWAFATAEHVAFYLLPGAVFVAIQHRITNWHQVILGGALIGWTIEAVMVPVSYEAMPISFFWTAVSFHGFVDMLFGCFILRLVLRGNGAWAIAVTVLFGVVWALWSSWPWPEVMLTPRENLLVACTAGGLISVGLFLMDRTDPALELSRWALVLIAVIVIGLAGLWVIPFLPFGLGLWALAGVTIWAFGRAPAGPTLVPMGRAPLWRYGLPCVAALIASGVYTWMYTAQFGIAQDEVIPLMLILTSLVFLYILGRAVWPRKSPTEPAGL